MIAIANEGKPDWNKLKAEYIAGGISLRAIAAKYDISFPALRYHSDKEQWAQERKDVAQKVVTESAQKTIDAAAANAVKLEKARALLIDKIMKAIELMPDKSGTHMRQSYADKESGKQISLDYDLMTLVNAFDKLSNGSTADAERQKRFAEENNTVLMSYADLFARAAPQRTIEDIEGEGGDEDV